MRFPPRPTALPPPRLDARPPPEPCPRAARLQASTDHRAQELKTCLPSGCLPLPSARLRPKLQRCLWTVRLPRPFANLPPRLKRSLETVPLPSCRLPCRRVR